MPAGGANNQSVWPAPQIRFTTGGSLIGYSPWNGGPAGFLVVAGAEPPDATGAPHSKPPLARAYSTIKKVVGAFGDADRALATHDTDKSGTLSKGEFAAALSKSRVTVDDAEVDELFARMDTDGNGEIDAKEFDAAFYAARLAGGIDLYLPVIPGGGPMKLRKEDVAAEVAYLESDAFKANVLYGWRNAAVAVGKI